MLGVVVQLICSICYSLMIISHSSLADEFCCLWQDCGFFSLDSQVELFRHVYFHCYHTKLKQLGLQALQSQPDLIPCQLDTQSRNMIPELQESFICMWDQCEVRGCGHDYPTTCHLCVTLIVLEL